MMDKKFIVLNYFFERDSEKMLLVFNVFYLSNFFIAFCVSVCKINVNYGKFCLNNYNNKDVFLENEELKIIM